MRRSELVRRLAAIPPPARPLADREQVVTPPEIAADLLFAALAAGDIEERRILDLGSGTGRLAAGAVLLGASRVVGIEIDPASVAIARAAVAGGRVEFREGDVADADEPADVVLMNPPFGAQRAHADRPFWDAAFRLARRRIYAFALAESRTFIARRAVAAHAHIDATTPVRWELARTFPHHSHRRRPIDVERWAIGVEPSP